MTRVSDQRNIVLHKVRVRLVYPQTPGLNLDTNGKMGLDLSIELRIRCEQLLNREIGTTPCVIDVTRDRSREETVVGEEIPSITRRENNLVPLALLATPVL